jgi:nitrogen fixation/metabolism regulation signal transduction histidine kinase
MGFSPPRHWPFAAGLAIRGLLAGCLVAGGVALVVSGRPVLGLIAGVLAILTLVALVRAARRAERAMRELIDQVASGANDRPSPLPPAFADLDAAIARAIDAMQARETRHGFETDTQTALLDTVPAALFVTDAYGRLIRSNRAARALAPTISAHFADHPAFVRDDAAALLASSPAAGRMLRLADGRAAHASVTLFDLADGTRWRLIAVQGVSKELGAVEADAWHRLSRVLAHEMMNSLSPVVSLAESMVTLAQDPSADPDRRETAAAAATIARRAQHLMGFVERYRQWLAIPEPQPTPVDLAEFVDEMIELARRFDPRVNVGSRGTVPAASVAMDRELVEQALLNLLKNAVEAAREQPQPYVMIGCHLDGGALTLAIEDNGHGLPASAEDIFLPFYTTKPEGAGIGLAIARQIALAHGGSLTAERMAEGTRFSMHLPVPNGAGQGLVYKP